MWKLVGTRWNRLAMVWERKKWGEVPKLYKRAPMCQIFKELGIALTCLVWKIASTHCQSLTGNNHLSKQTFISVLQMKSSSTCLITASLCEGPFVYFYDESSCSKFKHFLESIAVILSVMCLSQNTVNCGITLILVSLIFLLLVFPWTSEVPQHLCFAPQIKASGIPFFHILLWVLQSCSFLYFMLLVISALTLFHSLHNYEITLVAYFLLWIT
jgi:hypothetical protein